MTAESAMDVHRGPIAQVSLIARGLGWESIIDKPDYPAASAGTTRAIE